MKRSELKATIAKLQIEIKDSGDRVEKASWHFIKNYIPHYETYWSFFVFPYREDEPKSIWLNNELTFFHEALCIYNYSIFRALIRIHKLWKTAEIEYNISHSIPTEIFDDCVIWIDSAYDKIVRFACAHVANFTNIEPKEKYKIDENIIKLKSLYSNFESYSKSLYADIEKNKTGIALYRNYLIHNLKFPGFDNFIPTQGNLPELALWSKFREYIKQNAGKKPEELGRLQDRYLFIERESKNLIDLMNNIWEEFYKIEVDSKPDDEVLNLDKMNKAIKESLSKDKSELNLSDFHTNDAYTADPTLTSGYAGDVSGSTVSQKDK